MKRTTGSATAVGGHTVRGRIIRIVAPPLAAMVVLLTVFSAGEITRFRAATAAESRVTVILALQSLVQELQNERGVTVALLGGSDEFSAQLRPAREQVDNRRLAVRSLLDGGGELEDQAAASVGALDGLTEVRGRTDTRVADPDDTFDFYTTLIEELSDNTRHLAIVSDDELRRGAESVEQLVEIREATAQERVFLREVFTNGGFRDGEFSEFLAIVAARDLFLTELGEFATPATAADMQTLLASGNAVKARALEQAALGSGDGEQLRLSPDALWSELATVLDDLTQLAQRVGDGARHRAQVLREQATVRTGALAVVVLLCLAGSLYLATAGTKSLAGPLAMLAAEANRLARERLPEAVRRAAAGDPAGPPEPVPVTPGATSEIRQVADAFDRVRETAYGLATEQAQLRLSSTESLANLGRRNQNLLRRQLGFITHLEREESDPAGLANLFELDHLATRMRRNAESLLVLVGAASPRQWTRNLPLTDVIRAAVSEVEEYRRVVLRRMDDTLVQGWVASGLAHLLAELIENGLTFSPPDVEVEVHGRLLDGRYLIAICDQGVGMSDDDLRDANERLRGDGDFLTAPARFLGHYVVGRLAAEMGAQVQLATSPVTGVTARVHLPAEILAEPAPVAAPVRSRPLEVDYIVLDDKPAVPAAPEPAGDGERTPNGLRRRLPRERRPTPVPASPQRASEQRASEQRASGHGGTVTDSPAEVGNRLAALRDGMRRGTTDRSAPPFSTIGGNP
ncbi:nitrate- and nitrite sensing domain-containing protein [Actinoplanes sp. NPDC051494]|uniref:sensor histidine kinase n=1 Tax=Actinoplanes sp. NPDC051494 TaxID=3363907 RepID=UPI0037BC51A9